MRELEDHQQRGEDDELPVQQDGGAVVEGYKPDAGISRRKQQARRCIDESQHHDAHKHCQQPLELPVFVVDDKQKCAAPAGGESRDGEEIGGQKHEEPRYHARPARDLPDLVHARATKQAAGQGFQNQAGGQHEHHKKGRGRDQPLVLHLRQPSPRRQQRARHVPGGGVDLGQSPQDVARAGVQEARGLVSGRLEG